MNSRSAFAELNEGAELYCLGCGAPVRRDTPDTIAEEIATRAASAADPRLTIVFPVTVPKNFKESEVTAALEQQGYTRFHAKHGRVIEVVQDRFRGDGCFEFLHRQDWVLYPQMLPVANAPALQ